jgi:hypothetical protein
MNVLRMQISGLTAIVSSTNGTRHVKWSQGFSGITPTTIPFTKLRGLKLQRLRFGSCTAYLLSLLDSCDFIHYRPPLGI